MKVVGVITSKEQFADALEIFDPGNDILKLDEKNIMRVYEYVRRFRKFDLNYGADSFRLVSMPEFIAKLNGKELLKFIDNLQIKEERVDKADINDYSIMFYLKVKALDASDRLKIEDVFRAADEAQKDIEAPAMDVVAFDGSTRKLLVYQQ